MCFCQDCCERRVHWPTAQEAGDEAHRRWRTARALSTVVMCPCCSQWVVRKVSR